MKHISGSATHVGMDFVMRYLFNNKTYWPVLEGLLYCVLNRSVKITNVLSGETNKELSKQKMARIDIVVETEDKMLIVMEIQKEKQLYFLQRVIFGVSRMLVDHLKSGRNYEELRQVISANVLYFPLFKGMTDYIYDFEARLIGRNDGSVFEVSVTADQSEVKLLKQNQYVVPAYYFILVRNLDQQRAKEEKLNALEQWIYFFDHSEILPFFDAPGLKEANALFKRNNLSAEEQQMLTRYEMDLATQRDVLNVAIQEALEEERRRAEILLAAERKRTEAERKRTEAAQFGLVRRLLLDGHAVKYVAELMQLAEDEILKIQSSLDDTNLSS